MAEASVDARDFGQLLRAVNEFEPALTKELRKGIRIVAKQAAEASRAEVMKGPVSSRASFHIKTAKRKGQTIYRRRGLRQAIAESIGVGISTPKKGTGGVVIRASASQLGSAAPLVRAYDRPEGWRHPVFGTSDWVQQEGRPYFGSVIRKYQDQVWVAVEQAANAAAAAVIAKAKG